MSLSEAEVVDRVYVGWPAGPGSTIVTANLDMLRAARLVFVLSEAGDWRAAPRHARARWETL